MTDRPIMFSSPMVEALLAGRKTMTRRIIKPRLILAAKAGDRFWVREAWRVEEWDMDHVPPRALPLGTPLIYDADPRKSEPETRRRAPFHMPRWASRITLIVDEAKVERLQDISEVDAIAEGVEPIAAGGWKHYADTAPASLTYARDSFCSLWRSIHGPDAWAANPWVAALRFRTVLANIDTVEA